MKVIKLHVTLAFDCKPLERRIICIQIYHLIFYSLLSDSDFICTNVGSMASLNVVKMKSESDIFFLILIQKLIRELYWHL